MLRLEQTTEDGLAELAGQLGAEGTRIVSVQRERQFGFCQMDLSNYSFLDLV